MCLTGRGLSLKSVKRQVFYSFCYDDDCWRTQQIRNMGIVDGNQPASPNKWEQLKKSGDDAVYKWIDDNLKYRSCTIVLIGENTYSRKFVRYEIEKSWELSMGVFGINIHGLEDQYGKTANKGRSPFLNLDIQGTLFTDMMFTIHDANPIFIKSPYKYIQQNITDWIETAIADRKNWKPQFKTDGLLG